MNSAIESNPPTSSNPGHAEHPAGGSRVLSPEELRTGGYEEVKTWQRQEGAQKPTKNKARVDRWKEKAASRGLANVTITAPKVHHPFVKEIAREMKFGAEPYPAALVAAARVEAQQSRRTSSNPPNLWVRLGTFVASVVLAIRALYYIHLSPMREESLKEPGAKSP